MTDYRPAGDLDRIIEAQEKHLDELEARRHALPWRTSREERRSLLRAVQRAEDRLAALQARREERGA